MKAMSGNLSIREPLKNSTYYRGTSSHVRKSRITRNPLTLVKPKLTALLLVEHYQTASCFTVLEHSVHNLISYFTRVRVSNGA